MCLCVKWLFDSRDNGCCSFSDGVEDNKLPNLGESSRRDQVLVDGDERGRVWKLDLVLCHRCLWVCLVGSLGGVIVVTMSSTRKMMILGFSTALIQPVNVRRRSKVAKCFIEVLN